MRRGTDRSRIVMAMMDGCAETIIGVFVVMLGCTRAVGDCAMDLSNTRLINSVFAGGGDMGARMRAVDWSTTGLGPVEQWPLSLRACVRIVLGAGHPMLISWGPDYIMLYNDAYGVVVGTKHPGALGRSCREVLAEAWDFIGPRFDTVYKEGQNISTLTHQMFTFHRSNYLEECYFAFSYSPVPDDDGQVGGVLTNALDMTERVIEDRRIQVLRDVASRTAEARNEEEVWRVSAETLGQNRTSAPFAFLYEYLPGDHKARLASVSTETDDALHPTLIDCNSEGIWQFHAALTEDCLVVDLGERASGLSIPGWPLPPEKRPSCRSACASTAKRPGSLCWASIRAVRSTTTIVTSCDESPNKSPSAWLALVIRAGAPACGGAGGDRSRQDCILQQRQPRVSYSSRPDARAARRSVAGCTRAARSRTS